MSLARKISLLFGGSVLLVITVTLWSPSVQMAALTEQTVLLQARAIAAAVVQSTDLRQPDWTALHRELALKWPMIAEKSGFPDGLPTMIRADQPQQGHGFRAEAIRTLRTHPRQLYYWNLEQDNRVFRFAMAVRGSALDAHPTELHGIIDVSLLMPLDSGVWNSVVTVLAGASGAVLAILVFYMVIQRLVLTPVHTLRRAAERVATGDIHARSEIVTGDEFEKLSRTFNEMLAHLEAAQVEQNKVNRSLDVRLGELAQTNIALYESNRLKSEFLANVTHELRTPLVSIIGFAELLRDAWDGVGQTDPKRLQRFADNILSSGRNLLDIINDLLDVAKTEAGKMELHITEFSIAELCCDLVDFVQPLADKRNQALSLERQDDLPNVRSDSGKIKQILYNLLSNAIKFTPTGGSITLTAARSDGEFVQLSVRDTGPGIPPDKLETIFEKFHQLDSSTTREHAGTGLGLAITKDLVSLLGGDIQLQSRLGEGTTFIVRIPCTVAQPSPDRGAAAI